MIGGWRKGRSGRIKDSNEIANFSNYTTLQQRAGDWYRSLDPKTITKLQLPTIEGNQLTSARFNPIKLGSVGISDPQLGQAVLAQVCRSNKAFRAFKAFKVTGLADMAQDSTLMESFPNRMTLLTLTETMGNTGIKDTTLQCLNEMQTRAQLIETAKSVFEQLQSTSDYVEPNARKGGKTATETSLIKMTTDELKIFIQREGAKLKTQEPKPPGKASLQKGPDNEHVEPVPLTDQKEQWIKNKIREILESDYADPQDSLNTHSYEYVDTNTLNPEVAARAQAEHEYDAFGNDDDIYAVADRGNIPKEEHSNKSSKKEKEPPPIPPRPPGMGMGQ